jgi:UDP-glucuronate 4-epimerase
MARQVNILVTGAAGFIGWKVCEFLLTKPDLMPPAIPSPLMGEGKGEGVTVNVIGIDNLNDYYDVRLKQWRLDQLKQLSRHCEESSDEAISHNRFVFHHLDIEDYASLKNLFEEFSISPSHRVSGSPFLSVINLAARAGVRYSLENPFVYFTTNTLGNLNLLELCKEFGVKKYILASSSSLYAGQSMPFKEDLPVNEPISPYAASKKAAEVTCYTYHNLYSIDCTILRYFTVYGPASRPDMSPLRFISWVYQEKPVVIYGDGMQSRDFTYVDDIARGTIMALKPLGFEIINLGGDKPIKLLDFLHIIEERIGKKARIVHEPSHPADMQATWADITKATQVLSWQPNIDVEQGLEYSVEWYEQNHSWSSKISL